MQLHFALQLPTNIMARPLGDEAEYGEGEEEHHSLIELGSGGGGGLNKRRPLNGGGGAGALDRLADGGGTGGGPTCRWVSVLFLLALAGVYYLGLAEGKNEAIGGENGAEDVESKAREGEGGHEVLSPKQSSPASQSAPPPPPQPDDGKNEGTFTLEKLKLVREECLKLTSTLEAYYTSVDQTKDMLLKSWMDGWDFDAPEGEPAKRLRADKLVDTMARALVTDDQSTFLIGGIGSSVMAGHDNCHYDSYNSQMERLWQPVWRAAGMDFVFQNAGEGGSCGDSHQNQVYCVRQNVSPDVDIVHYEWTYFEGGTAAPEHESLIRWTQMMSKQPPVNIYNTGELSQKAINMDKDLITTYAQYGFNAFYMKTSFVAGGYDYDAEKKNPDESKRIDRFSWGYVGDGYHETTRYGEDEEDDARKSSLGVVMRNWHPGPMGFQLTSDAFVYTYTLAVMKALDLIEADMNAGNDPRDKWAASERPLLMKGDLPAPKACDPEYCVVDEAPGCLNYELPTFGYWGARVEDPDDEEARAVQSKENQYTDNGLRK